MLGTHLRELIIQPIRMLDLAIRPDPTVYVLPKATSGPLSLLCITGIALDVAALNVQHIRLDENGRFLSVIQDGLNTCLTVEANIDQTARAFIQDIVVSMLDEGCVAIVPLIQLIILPLPVRMTFKPCESVKF